MRQLEFKKVLGNILYFPPRAQNIEIQCFGFSFFYKQSHLLLAKALTIKTI